MTARLDPVRYLKASANVAATTRGHRIGQWIAGGGDTLVADCRNCGAMAVIDPAQGCTQTAVGGPATQKRCHEEMS